MLLSLVLLACSGEPAAPEGPPPPPPTIVEAAPPAQPEVKPVAEISAGPVILKRRFPGGIAVPFRS